MWSFITRRLIILVPIVIGVSFLVFTAMYILPGDAVDSMLAERGASAEELARLRRQLGLDQPFLVQYGRFIGRLVTGDLGASIVTGRPVADQIASQLPATIELTLASLLIAVLVALSYQVAKPAAGSNLNVPPKVMRPEAVPVSSLRSWSGSRAPPFSTTLDTFTWYRLPARRASLV